MRPLRLLLLLTALYLAQGLPYGFFTQALPVLMREAGYSLTKIAAASLLFLPWALKFLWAPYVDRIGTRRQWLLVLQGATLAGALLLAMLDLSRALWPVFAALLLFNIIAATQDIATDGLAATALGPRERGLANGLQVGGYRLGMILGGGLLLWIYAAAGWQPMFIGMALMLALASLPVLWLREPPAPAVAGEPPTAWWPRLRRPGMPLLIALICAYKFGDSMGAALIGPLMKDSGASLEQIAWIKGVIGSLSALAGAGLGALMAFHYGRRFTLLFGGASQTLSLLLYGLCALGIGGVPLLIGASIAEHVFGGIATVALFTLMMDTAQAPHAGTDYTLLASSIVITQALASLSAGVVADATGYAPMLWLSTLLSAAGCALLIIALDRGAGPTCLRGFWR